MSAQAQVDNEVKGRLALVTGASGGLGAACARELYSQGCHLALTYSASKAKVDELIASFPSDSSRRISSHKVDMGEDKDFDRLFQELEKEHGQPGPDILVSNAGRGARISSIIDIPVEEFDLTLRINLRASFILCKLSAPHMIAKHWGRIILMGSIAGYGGGINGCHYAASKAGLMGMCKNLAQKLAKDGISVNDVAPAMIGETGMIPDAKAVEGSPGDVKNIPVGRLGVPQEVGNVVGMLVKTGYLTGQSIVIGGGLK
ncbi:3-oxoacyl-[acyl-carrier-protein] FabG [Cyphellophora attinorum]|uniref:3-oxoacyl-[acyl-carrier-protein] FabG n=1 Tax=Cyphellophora attinorum TaxID=1664694 RepID=A0A0N1HDM1_9EURO|nr:3-oxoacyl-[acyl-carrier-protein] FabG [Phialophora attinorum]KPI43120.1 3-oxoacyl-[acyl-carrier-protein] FabG [Phialophora attinorum]